MVSTEQMFAREENAMRSYRIVNYRRFIGFLVFTFLLVAITVSFILNNNIARGSGLNETLHIVVKEGDTLWELASNHMHRQDIRKGVESIRRENNLKDAIIVPGQEIKIPTK